MRIHAWTCEVFLLYLLGCRMLLLSVQFKATLFPSVFISGMSNREWKRPQKKLPLSENAPKKIQHQIKFILVSLRSSCQWKEMILYSFMFIHKADLLTPVISLHLIHSLNWSISVCWLSKASVRRRLLCVVETDTPKATSQQARTMSIFKVSCVGGWLLHSW